MIISSSIIEYNTFDIKRAVDTGINELSNDGSYDYLPLPSYDLQSPYSIGPFWKNDNMLIKWNYTEALNNLIPSTSIYLVSSSKDYLIRGNVPTQNKNINWTIPSWVEKNVSYFIKIQSNFENQLIEDVSPTFTFDERFISITSKLPTTSLIANEGNVYDLTWDKHGTSDYFKIELIESNIFPEIKIKNIGKIILNPLDNIENVTTNTSLPSDSPKAEVISVIEDKYYSPIGEYTWTINNIPSDINEARIKITDIQNSTYTISDIIKIKVPSIKFTSYIGRKLAEEKDVTTSISGSGDGIAQLTLFDFKPADRKVINSGDLQFSFTATNTSQLYLTKLGDTQYSEVISNTGRYTIRNIQKDETYSLNAKDSSGKIVSSEFDVELILSQSKITTILADYSLYQFLQYQINIMDESLSSGDVIIDSDSTVISKIQFYKNEASQVDESTSNSAMWYLIKGINSDVFEPLISGNTESPQIIVFESNFRKSLINASNEVNRRYNLISAQTRKISGHIYDIDKNGIAGVVIRFNNGLGQITTDSNGYYEINAPYNYSGIATPEKAAMEFTPPTIKYESLVNDVDTQNYTAKSVPAQTNAYLNVTTYGLHTIMKITQDIKPDNVITVTGTSENKYNIVQNSPITFELGSTAADSILSFKVWEGNSDTGNLIYNASSASVPQKFSVNANSRVVTVEAKFDEPIISKK